MDSLTHLLVGNAMGAAASNVAHPYGTAVYWAVLVGNSLPDIDVPISLVLGRGIKLHRTVTHTIPGSVILSALAAAAICAFVPGSPFGVVFGWTLMGSLVHMALDCLNLFGAPLLWPLSQRAVEVGVLHILDPFLIALLGTASLAAAFHLVPQSVLAWSFVLMWPYVIYRIATARKLYWRLRAAGSSRVRVIPWYTSWRYVFETHSSIEFGHWIRGRQQAVKTYLKLDHPVIQASLADPKVTAFLAAAEYPYAEVEEGEDGPAVVWGDALRQLRADFRPLRVRVNQGQHTEASGVMVTVEPQDLLGILSMCKEPLVVIAPGGWFQKQYQYLVPYKGLAFYAQSETALPLPPDTQVVTAKRIWIPG